MNASCSCVCAFSGLVRSFSPWSSRAAPRRPQSPQQAACRRGGLPRSVRRHQPQDFRLQPSVDATYWCRWPRPIARRCLEPVRNSLRDFLHNLQEPMIFANDMLQGDSGGPETRSCVSCSTRRSAWAAWSMSRALGHAVSRAGSGHDARRLGHPAGPYLVVPILGPSDPRDLGGEVAEGLAIPCNILATDNHLLCGCRSCAAGSAASTSGRAISTPSPISSAPRSTITRRSARSIVSAARR